MVRDASLSREWNTNPTAPTAECHFDLPELESARETPAAAKGASRKTQCMKTNCLQASGLVGVGLRASPTMPVHQGYNESQAGVSLRLRVCHISTVAWCASSRVVQPHDQAL